MKARIVKSKFPRIIGMEVPVFKKYTITNSKYGHPFDADLSEVYKVLKQEYWEDNIDAFCLEHDCAHIGGDWEFFDETKEEKT